MKKIVIIIVLAVSASMLIGMSIRTYNIRYRAIRHAEFFADGSLREIGTYRNGKPYGEWATFYPDGKQRMKYFLDNKGQLSDSLTIWHPTGEYWVKGFYVRGEKRNCWLWFGTDGIVLRKECYSPR